MIEKVSVHVVVMPVLVHMDQLDLLVHATHLDPPVLHVWLPLGQELSLKQTLRKPSVHIPD